MNKITNLMTTITNYPDLIQVPLDVISAIEPSCDSDTEDELYYTTIHDVDVEDVEMTKTSEALQSHTRSFRTATMLEEVIEATIFTIVANTDIVFLTRLYYSGSTWVYTVFRRGDPSRHFAAKIELKHGKSRLNEYPIETRTLSRLQGIPGVQQIYSYYSLPHAYMILSDMYRDDSLTLHVFDKPDSIMHYMAQVVQILHRLHSRGIIYRDLKTSNLMYDAETGCVTIIDFDLATYNYKKHCTVLGTDNYMSPEVLAFENAGDEEIYNKLDRYTEKVDIYSLGVVFGQLLHSVSECDVTSDTVRDWKLSTHTSVAHDLMTRLLNDSPDNRPTIAAIMDHVYFSDFVWSAV
jgi:serine/threonine protein kinase